jgi:hypothetical protein
VALAAVALWVSVPALAATTLAQPPLAARAGQAVEPSETPASNAAIDLPVLELTLDAGALSRSLSYTQDIFGDLGGYALRAGPLIGGSLGFYPLAIVTRGFLGNIGLFGSAVHTVGVGSNLGSTNYPTLEDEWSAGLRVRIPLPPVELGVRVGYGGQEFRFGIPPLSAMPSVPSYTYGLLSGVVDARISLGSFAILVDGGDLFVTSDGIAKSGYFPHATVNGVEAGLALALVVFDPVELRLGANYQRFFFAMHSRVGDTNVAGGAVDQYLESTLGFAVRIQ